MAAHESAIGNVGLHPLASARRLRTLVVDDPASGVEVICALSEMQDEVEVVGRAADAGEAIEMVAALVPDLVLLDAQLRGMSSATTALLLTLVSPSTNVALMSSHASPRLQAERRASGITGVLYKPALSTELRGWLAARR